MDSDGQMKLQVTNGDRDWINLEVEANGENWVVLNSEVFGCHKFTEQAKRFLENLESGERPEFDQDHGGTILKEVYLKVTQNWNPPYQDPQICHCRMVPTEQVCRAIRGGAESVEKISRWTSSTTACGSCRPDVQSLIDYYMNVSTETEGD